jgi:UrcA family protein
MPFLDLQPAGGAATRPTAHNATAALLAGGQQAAARSDRRHRAPPSGLLRRVMFGLAIAAACFGAAQARTPYLRTDADGAPMVKVAYDDLDLGGDQGARTMLTRISNAARLVCGPEPSIGMVDRTAYWRACVHAAEVDAIKRLGSAKVAELFHGRPATRLYAGR